MDNFNPITLKLLRKQRRISVADIATAMDVSVAQIHRLENGERRLTVDTLLRFCNVLDLDICQLFAEHRKIPVNGIVNSDYEVLPTPPQSEQQISLPAILPGINRVAALRWEPSGHISGMAGHILLYYNHHEGIPERAWGTRCFIAKRDGYQCVGWPMKDESATHIEIPEGRTQFNVELEWASPILAVLAPSAVNILQMPTSLKAE
ncbi:MAG: helix-turn-helix transcriptional regulator [Pseudomonadales bacterium]|nr:helix-turn-helix transcriptional regulator [Pseudomonadales bacterium]MBO7005205.1 helix-turn-helix transcriptional regulator [Pseudomonadales bacterium]